MKEIDKTALWAAVENSPRTMSFVPSQDGASSGAVPQEAEVDKARDLSVAPASGAAHEDSSPRPGVESSPCVGEEQIVASTSVATSAAAIDGGDADALAASLPAAAIPDIGTGINDAAPIGPVDHGVSSSADVTSPATAGTRTGGSALVKAPSTVVHTPLTLLNDALTTQVETDAADLLGKTEQLVIDHRGIVYVVRLGAGNPMLMRLGSSEFRGLIAKALRASGQRIGRYTIDDLIEELKAEAEVTGVRADVWRRVAQLADGTVVIALHDDANTQVRITAGKVELVAEGSPVLFYRTAVMSAMAVPAPVGNLKLLRKYLNLDWPTFTLYVGWVTYTIAHGKVQGSVFVILVFVGGQGAGKSLACRVTIALIDRNVVGVERMPSNVKDLAIAAQNHVVGFDNIRHISPTMSDALCTMATGGAVTGRALYTDDQQHLISLHGAVILNGIYSFVDQPDLAQRSLPMRLEPIAEGQRKSEAAMLKDFEAELPTIMRGLYDLIAAIKLHLPAAKVTHPQRMLDFVTWLAAMEMAQNAPAGTYQQVYEDLLNEGQLDSLRDNVLGAAVLDFAETLGDEEWAGTPTELLAKLNRMQHWDLKRLPRNWPDNEIAMSRRLVPLQAALSAQGIEVHFKRGRQRTVTIRKIGGAI